MVLAECVGDLAQHRAQRTFAIEAVPDRNRVEHVAQHAREGLEHHLAIGAVDAVGAQLRADPRLQVGAVPRPEVAALVK